MTCKASSTANISSVFVLHIPSYKPDSNSDFFKTGLKSLLALNHNVKCIVPMATLTPPVTDTQTQIHFCEDDIMMMVMVTLLVAKYDDDDGGRNDDGNHDDDGDHE